MEQQIHIIGLSGTNGAGKDTVGEVLAAHHGYLFISVTDLLREEVRRRGLPVEREHLRTVSAEWRRAHGLAVLIDRAISAWKATAGQYKGVVISSLRNPAEADRIHELGGSVIWVDADPSVRYARISAGNRGRGAEDNKTFEQFIAEGEAEMRPPADGDAANLNMSVVRDKADMTIVNNHGNIEAFQAAIEQRLGL